MAETEMPVREPKARRFNPGREFEARQSSQLGTDTARHAGARPDHLTVTIVQAEIVAGPQYPKWHSIDGELD
jgi:hypothetical protein